MRQYAMRLNLSLSVHYPQLAANAKGGILGGFLGCDIELRACYVGRVSKCTLGFFAVLIVAGCSLSRKHKPDSGYATDSSKEIRSQTHTNVNTPISTNTAVANTAVARAVATNSVETADAVNREYEKLMEDDDAAQAEVDQWIQD